MPVNKKILFILLTLCSLWFLTTVNIGCKIYKFNDVTINPNIKTVRVHFIENKARYVNPQLSPQFSDKLRQKIVNQTRLTQVNNDNSHLDISGYISDYSISTSGISNQQVATNRLTVGVHIIVFNRLENLAPQAYDVSRSFDFSASLTLQQAEAKLNEEIIRNLVDEVFNRIFSNW